MRSILGLFGKLKYLNALEKDMNQLLERVEKLEKPQHFAGSPTEKINHRMELINANQQLAAIRVENRLKFLEEWCKKYFPWNRLYNSDQAPGDQWVNEKEMMLARCNGTVSLHEQSYKGTAEGVEK